MTLIITHPSLLDHDTGPQHPERPARLDAVLDRLRAPDFAALAWAQAGAVTDAAIFAVHPAAHVARLAASMPKHGRVAHDEDTILSPGTDRAMRLAAGAVVAAVDAVIAGTAANAFCAVRPPGHHAERDRAMGFCLLNNAAIGARHAQSHDGIARVAIVDFDVHHGNGTQEIFADDPTVFFASTHQSPLYPGTGAATETGAGNILNVPLAAHSGSVAFRAAFTDRMLPALARFDPDFLLISAGFDGHRDDPLAQLDLEAEDFAWVTDLLCDLAAIHCAGRLVSTLEGGYDLEALAACAAAHVARLMAHS